MSSAQSSVHLMRSERKPAETERDPGLALAGALGLEPPVLSAQKTVEAAFVGKYGGPTSLQRRVMLSVVANERSALVVAPTASGKTEAAVMALTTLHLDRSGTILYLAPTRALINDLAARLRPGFSSWDWRLRPATQKPLPRLRC